MRQPRSYEAGAGCTRAAMRQTLLLGSARARQTAQSLETLFQMGSQCPRRILEPGAILGAGTPRSSMENFRIDITSRGDLTAATTTAFAHAKTATHFAIRPASPA